MCNGKKQCSCGCAIKKKSMMESKKILKEGTWAPDVWDKNVALQAKNILQNLSDTSDSVDISRLLKRFEKKFWNKIGDDKLYDLTGQAAHEYEKGLPNWKNTLTYAIQRIDELENGYQTRGIKESKKNSHFKKELLEKINLKLTSNTKIEMVKQAKNAMDAMYSIYLQIERKDIEHDSFLNMVDQTFENISELLAVLVSQESVETIKK